MLYVRKLHDLKMAWEEKSKKYVKITGSSRGPFILETICINDLYILRVNNNDILKYYYK